MVSETLLASAASLNLLHNVANLTQADLTKLAAIDTSAAAITAVLTTTATMADMNEIDKTLQLDASANVVLNSNVTATTIQAGIASCSDASKATEAECLYEEVASGSCANGADCYCGNLYFDPDPLSQNHKHNPTDFQSCYEYVQQTVPNIQYFRYETHTCTVCSDTPNIQAGGSDSSVYKRTGNTWAYGDGCLYIY